MIPTKAQDTALVSELRKIAWRLSRIGMGEIANKRPEIASHVAMAVSAVGHAVNLFDDECKKLPRRQLSSFLGRVILEADDDLGNWECDTINDKRMRWRFIDPKKDSVQPAELSDPQKKLLRDIQIQYWSENKQQWCVVKNLKTRDAILKRADAAPPIPKYPTQKALIKPEHPVEFKPNFCCFCGTERSLNTARIGSNPCCSSCWKSWRSRQRAKD